jgi:hypothetical protein
MGLVKTAKQARNAMAAIGLGAVVAVGAALAPASSHAAVVVGAFDPAFGPFLPNFGYRGLASIFVPDACFASTGIVSNSDPCASGAMTVQSAILDFYNVNTPGQPTLVNYTLNPSVVFNVQIAFDSTTNRNELVGVDTNFSAAVAASLNDGLGVNFSNVNFYFGFSAAFGGPGAGGAVLLACTFPLIECLPSLSVPGTVATTVFGTRDGGAPTPRNLPEPGAACLSLLALGVAAVATRRRKNQT